MYKNLERKNFQTLPPFRKPLNGEEKNQKQKRKIHETMLLQDFFFACEKFIQKNQQQVYIVCYKNSLGTCVHGGLERKGLC